METFLSYDRNNEGFVTAARRRLEGRGLGTFQDLEDIPAGADFRQRIGQALDTCDVMIVFVTRAAMASKEVRWEIEGAQERDIQVIPFLMEDSDEVLKSETFGLISQFQWINGAVDREAGLDKLLTTIARRNSPTTPVVVMSNLKGGVGKTTLCHHLFSAIFRNWKLSILLVDLDPQSNLSQLILKECELDQLRQDERSVISLFEAGKIYGRSAASDSLMHVNLSGIEPKRLRMLPHYLQDEKTKKLGLIAGQFQTVKYTISHNKDALPQVQDNFRQALNEAKRSFDIVVIDLNPSSSILMECALRAATHVVCPVRPDKFSLEGITLLRSLATDAFGKNIDPNLIVLMNGVAWDRNDESEDSIRKHDFYGTKVLKARIPQTDMLTAKFSQSVFDIFQNPFATKGPAGSRLKESLDAAGQELLERLNIYAEPEPKKKNRR